MTEVEGFQGPSSRFLHILQIYKYKRMEKEIYHIIASGALKFLDLLPALFLLVDLPGVNIFPNGTKVLNISKLLLSIL